MNVTNSKLIFIIYMIVINNCGSGIQFTYHMHAYFLLMFWNILHFCLKINVRFLWWQFGLGLGRKVVKFDSLWNLGSGEYHAIVMGGGGGGTRPK